MRGKRAMTASAEAEPMMPPGTPLLAKPERAAEIFGVSAKTLYRMRLCNSEFDRLTIKIGNEVLYDVPRCYQWFAQYLGESIGTT